MSQVLVKIRPRGFRPKTPSRNGKCEMCQDEDLLLITSSGFGGVSYALCVDCMTLGLDPLDPDLVKRLNHIVTKCKQVFGERWNAQ